MLLQMALDQGADLDRLERLMQMQERWDDTQARKAFNFAFAAFKAEAISIVRSKEVTDGPLKGKKQAELGAIIKAVTPALSKHGLSLNYRMTKDDPQWMEVTTTLRHIDGHSESVSMGGAPDTGPGRNAIQARGSAKTYLERYTTLGILGLAPEDDDDGRGGPKVDAASLEAAIQTLNECRTLDSLQKTFSELWNGNASKPFRESITRAKDERKAFLRGGAR